MNIHVALNALSLRAAFSRKSVFYDRRLVKFLFETAGFLEKRFFYSKHKSVRAVLTGIKITRLCVWKKDEARQGRNASAETHQPD